MRRSSLSLLLLATACPGPPKEPPAHVPPDIHMENITLQTFKGSDARLEVRAPTLQMMRSTGDFTMEDASVRLPAQGLSAQAPRLSGNLNAGVLEGSGGLEVRGDDGVVARTPYATFHRNLGPEGGVVSDAGVRLEDPRFTLEAQGFSVDFATQTAHFERPVTQSR
ncbi:MAG: hypothetical protein AB1938_33025 [Myxococcota bacterium]